MAKTTRGTPARRRKTTSVKKTSVKKKTTIALAPRTVSAVDAQPVSDARTIGDGIALGELGLVELTLSADEERMLSEPPPVDRVRILPTGMVYAPHMEYTRLFNRAFGRTGWALVPVGKPALAQKTVVCPYILFIHGKPVAFAQGEQDFFDNNKGQSYGDALESTVASGLRRCAKRLGVWLDLWDRAWGDAFVREQGVKVWCEVDSNGEKKTKPQWRLKTDPPFWNEKKDRSRGPATEDPPAGYNPDAGEPVTTEMRQRLVNIIRRSGRAEHEVAMWLTVRYGVDSLKGLKRRDYDFVTKCIEHPGPLPMNEPGA